MSEQTTLPATDCDLLTGREQIAAVFIVFWFAFTHTPTAFTARLPVSPGEQAALALINGVVVGQDILEIGRNAFAGGGFLDGRWMLVGQAWSLSTEFLFYCLAPFVVRSPRRILALLAASLAVRTLVVGWLGLSGWIWGYYFFPGVLCMFLLGSLAYHLHVSIKPQNGKLLAIATATAWAAWLVYSVATAGIMLPYGPGTSIDGFVFWFAYVGFAASVPIIFAWSKSNWIDRLIGDLSYPLYLVHGVVQGIIFFRWGAPQGVVSWMLVAVSASVFFAILMRLVIEIPTERWLQRKPLVKGASALRVIES